MHAVLVLAAWAQQAAAPGGAATTQPTLEPGTYANIVTSLGTVKAKLYEKESPITVKNFMDLALGRKEWTDPKTGQKTKRRLYPGTTFHRVIPEFMIQGGDPLGNGTGGTEPIPDEFDPSLKFDKPGILAMANAGPGTGSSQFFITERPTAHLNGRHTIFGQVVEGQDVVNKIANVPRGPDDKPNTPVTIRTIAFERVGADGKRVPMSGAVAPVKPRAPGATKPRPRRTTPAAKPSGAKPAAAKPKPAAAKSTTTP